MPDHSVNCVSKGPVAPNFLGFYHWIPLVIKSEIEGEERGRESEREFRAMGRGLIRFEVHSAATQLRMLDFGKLRNAILTVSCMPYALSGMVEDGCWYGFIKATVETLNPKPKPEKKPKP